MDRKGLGAGVLLLPQEDGVGWQATVDPRDGKGPAWGMLEARRGSLESPSCLEQRPPLSAPRQWPSEYRLGS